MIVRWERVGNCLWHRDCPENRWGSGVVRVVDHEDDQTLLECMCCGQRACLTRGAPSNVDVRIADHQEGR